jgi:hypothetical protein
LHPSGLRATGEARVEARLIQAEGRGVLLQLAVGQIALVLEDEVVVLEKLVLVGGAFRGPRRGLRTVMAGERKVPKNPADLAGVDVLGLEGRKLLPGKPAAKRSLQVIVFDDNQRGRRVAEDVVVLHELNERRPAVSTVAPSRRGEGVAAGSAGRTAAGYQENEERRLHGPRASGPPPGL